MSVFHMREADDNDCGQLVPLISAFFREEGIPADERRITRNLMVMLADERAMFLVCEVEGVVTGFVSATMTHGLEFGWAAEIEDLYVLPEWRGRGLSRQLMDAAERWCGDRGVDQVQVVLTRTGRADQGLEGFYSRQGYRDDGRLLMYKQLPVS